MPMPDLSEPRTNGLWEYVQSLPPEVVEQLSRPSSPEARQVMERNIIGLLGQLPAEHFHVQITVDRESLGRLLASAMISGYFLRNVEQRYALDHCLQESNPSGGANS